jgi:hypothetical protein
MTAALCSRRAVCFFIEKYFTSQNIDYQYLNRHIVRNNYCTDFFLFSPLYHNQIRKKQQAIVKDTPQ